VHSAECRIDRVVEAERRALGVGQLELIIPESRPDLADAAFAVALLGFLPRVPDPVKESLCDPVQHGRPVPVTQVTG
jgi:hypothetical protein